MPTTSPIVHHPFTFGIGPINLTGFGIAVLLAFVIVQNVSARELTRRGHDREAAAVSDLLITLAGIERFIVEFFRAKRDRFSWALGLSTAQLIALVITGIGVIMMMQRSKVGPTQPGIIAVTSLGILLASACVIPR